MMTELNNPQNVIHAVEKDGARTREAVVGLGQDIRDLPQNLATALRPYIDPNHNKSGGGSMNGGLLVTTAISVLFGLLAIGGSMVSSLENSQAAYVAAATARFGAIKDSMAIDNVREEQETKQIAVLQTEVSRTRDDVLIVYRVLSNIRTEERSMLTKKIAQLEASLERARGQ
jgi:hypothetical protein